MCGIVYYHSKVAHSVGKPILKRYRGQKERGTRGFGVVSIDMDTLSLSSYTKKAEEEEIIKCMDELKALSSKSNAILFHHRQPTSTPNFEECAHPILVKNDELEHVYFVAHNGVLSNEDELKKIHNALGYTYTTEIKKETRWVTAETNYIEEEDTQFNDSEALAIELARYIEKKADKMEAKGSIAFIVIQCDKDLKAKKLYFGRNYMNPLYLEHDKHSFCLKSVGAHKDSVDGHKLYSYDYATGLISEEKLDIGTNVMSNPELWRRGNDNKVDNAIGKLLPPRDDYEYNHYHGEDFRDGRYNTGVPSLTYKQYLEEMSVMDVSTDEYIEQGYELQDIANEIWDEMIIVDDLISWEEALGDTGHVKFLKSRMSALEIRQNVLTARINEEEARTERMGYNTSDSH